jgi:hypothetical protein
MLAHSPRVLYIALALALAATPLSAKEAKHAAKPAAQPAAAAAAPAPPPELSQLAFFEGSFSCSGKAFANPMGPEHATTATLHGAKAIGGRWVHISYDENKTTANPTPYHAGLYIGYDAAKKTFVSSCFDNMGGYCNQTSQGWNGDTLIIEGTSNMDGKQSGARDTLVKRGANQLIHTGEFQGDDKKWVKLDEETCNKGK